MNKNNTKTLTASQRLEGLENVAMALDQVIANQARDLSNLRVALKELINFQTALVNVLRAGLPPTEENLEADLVRQKEQDLKNRLEDLKTQGIVESTDKVSDLTLIVVREMDSQGNVVNPRAQFLFDAMKDEIKDLLRDKKPGDSVKFDANEDIISEIQEVYKLVTPEVSSEPVENSSESIESQEQPQA